MTDTTPQHTLDHENYAGFWVRFFAACIDMVLYSPAYYAILYASAIITHHNTPDIDWWGEGTFMVFGLLTYPLFFASRWQASPGMYLLKFHVCSPHGQRIGFTRAFIWGVVGTIGWLICCAGVIYMQTHFDLNQVRDLIMSCNAYNIAPEDCSKEIEDIIKIPFVDFVHILYASAILMLFLLLIWALSIGLPKDKTGFNNLICGTRFVKGRV